MTRLATHIRLEIGKETVDLRPSLRAAFTLAREFETMSPILKGIGEGNLSIFERLFELCGDFNPALDDLFTIPDRSIARRIAELTPFALDLVSGLLGIDPDAKQEADEDDRPAEDDAKPETLVERCESLFGFATGILRWTPDAAWNALPGEIMTAWKFRADAYAPAEKNGAGLRSEDDLSADEKAMLASANMQDAALNRALKEHRNAR